MQNQNPFFEDFSRLMSSVAGTMAGAGREAETRMRERFREMMGGMDMVSREEFEAVKTMAAEAKAELEALKAELEALRGTAAPAAKPDRAPRAKAQKIDIS
jgi:BMFP domain-containing protein YqiC